MRDVQTDLDQFGFTYMDYLAPFSFDPDKKQFVVGEGDKVRQLNLKDVGTIFDLTGKSKRDTEPTERSPLMISGMSHLVETSNMRGWLMQKSFADKTNVVEVIEDVMRKAYLELSPGAKIPKSRKRGDQLWMGISAQISETGVFSLQTFGNCACMTPMPNPDSILFASHGDHREDPEMPVEFWLHNTDTDAEMLSLYAGAGTLAYLARQKLS